MGIINEAYTSRSPLFAREIDLNCKDCISGRSAPHRQIAFLEGSKVFSPNHARTLSAFQARCTTCSSSDRKEGNSLMAAYSCAFRTVISKIRM